MLINIGIFETKPCLQGLTFVCSLGLVKKVNEFTVCLGILFAVKTCKRTHMFEENPVSQDSTCTDETG